MLSVFLISFAYAVGEASYCCERLDSNGAWCQNAPMESCDSDYRKVPTSCESTSYCKLGTCINSQDGICMENTPQKVCENEGGIWEDADSEDIPQCQLGCCLIGDQAAFVTQTRCKRLSFDYGLETNFRTDIVNEVQCILSATSEVKGACVFEKEYETTCLFITKRECSEMNMEDGAEFHEGYLCSAGSLGTNCGRSEKTTCVEGRDEVYYLDSCGNLANIYDASKINDLNYWKEVKGKDESCNSGVSNAGSETCGNCDYFLGSTCKSYDRKKDGSKPNLKGDNICRDLSCEYEGVDYEHGETWCAEAEGVSSIEIQSDGEIESSGKDLPGGRYFRLVCYNGEVSVEPCADYRQEVCIQSKVNEFKAAACRVNMWQDCYSQTEEKDCENTERRDCKWETGSCILKDSDGECLTEDEEGDKIKASCVPRNAPGFNFWETDGGDAESLCSMASVTCEVTYEREFEGFFEETDWDCKKNCGCCVNRKGYTGCKGDLPWKEEMNDLCVALGDCGVSVNYFGTPGYNELE